LYATPSWFGTVSSSVSAAAMASPAMLPEDAIKLEDNDPLLKQTPS
jgi:hypothetical protein